MPRHSEHSVHRANTLRYPTKSRIERRRVSKGHALNRVEEVPCISAGAEPDRANEHIVASLFWVQQVKPAETRAIQKSSRPVNVNGGPGLSSSPNTVSRRFEDDTARYNGHCHP